MCRRTRALRIGLSVWLLLGSAAAAHAQNDDSHWGVAVGWVPQWEANDFVKILFDAERLQWSGDEFRIGIARGRPLGGDWSLSYIRKSVDPGSISVLAEPEFFDIGDGQVFLFSERLVTRDVRFDGLEFNKFVSFATIKRRVQIGMNFGVGVARVKGTVVRESQFVDFSEFNFQPFQVSSETEESATELLAGGIDYMPLGKIEVAVGAIIVPGLKVRVSGGFNMPGVPAIGGTIVYLFGAH